MGVTILVMINVEFVKSGIMEKSDMIYHLDNFVHAVTSYPALYLN